MSLGASHMLKSSFFLKKIVKCKWILLQSNCQESFFCQKAKHITNCAWKPAHCVSTPGHLSMSARSLDSNKRTTEKIRSTNMSWTFSHTVHSVEAITRFCSGTCILGKGPVSPVKWLGWAVTVAGLRTVYWVTYSLTLCLCASGVNMCKLIRRTRAAAALPTGNLSSTVYEWICYSFFCPTEVPLVQGW